MPATTNTDVTLVRLTTLVEKARSGRIAAEPIRDGPRRHGRGWRA